MVATANPTPPAAPKLPDIPAHLVKCIGTAPKTPPGATANDKVAALHLTSEQRKDCAKAILAWYKRLQAAEVQGKPKKG